MLCTRKQQCVELFCHAMLVLQHLWPKQPTKPRGYTLANDLPNPRQGKIYFSLEQLFENLNLKLEVLKFLETMLTDAPLLGLAA